MMYFVEFISITLTKVVNGEHETDYWLGYGDHEIDFEKLAQLPQFRPAEDFFRA
jgi:hypothetical protein